MNHTNFTWIPIHFSQISSLVATATCMNEMLQTCFARMNWQEQRENGRIVDHGSVTAIGVVVQRSYGAVCKH